MESQENGMLNEEQQIVEHLRDESSKLFIDFTEKLDKLRSIPSCSNENTERNEIDETTSYLDMHMRKYENYELVKTKDGLNEYVDIVGKRSEIGIDDDNIYDNYLVENRKSKESMKMKSVSEIYEKRSTDEKYECPFKGLPAAHLTIVQSPKIGWLVMHLRRRRSVRNFSLTFKRKYYAGLVMENKEIDEEPYNWWLLLYSGGKTELKPTLSLHLNQFNVLYDHTHTASSDQQQNKIQCKFEMNEKSSKKDAKSYCFLAETPEHCEQWIDLLRQLSNGQRYIENVITATAQIRKLPMLPINTSLLLNENFAQDIDTVDTNNDKSNANAFNHSEGVYEEPEEYYKNVPAKKNNFPNLPVKKISQSAASTLRMDDCLSIYDTPKPSIRTIDDDKCFNNIGKAAHDDDMSTLDLNRLKIDEVRTKLRTQLKDQTQKYLSSTSSQNQTIAHNSVAETSTNNKYQLNIVRKWLFTNHLAKIRHSTNPTNTTRKSSVNEIDSDAVETLQNQQHKQNSSNTEIQQRAIYSQPKGNKVHMIINQLETKLKLKSTELSVS